ncbi:MAG: DUF3040 domain-containing protein [Microthrixaceae bacterium]
MPLSEEEQRILAQIEASLLASDPALARHVGSGRMSRETKRRLQIGLAGFLVAVVGSVLLLSVHFILAFVAFLAAFGALAYVQSDIRALSRARITQAREDIRAGVKDSMRDIGERRDRGK